jgi:hypothetical protein
LSNTKGVITGQFLKPVDGSKAAEDPGVKRYLADYDAAKPRFEKGDTLGQIGYAVGDALVQVLSSMKAPTREAMMDAASPRRINQNWLTSAPAPTPKGRLFVLMQGTFME